SPTIVLEEPIKTGYSFEGWYTDAGFSGLAIINIDQHSTGNLELYANWTINQYTITFELNEGDPIDSVILDYNSVITLPTTTLEGYTFIGWYTDDVLITEFTYTNMPAYDFTIYAAWEINQYTISYYDVIDSMSMINSTVGFSVGLTATGRVFTWGTNTIGQLGDGTTIDHFLPFEITHMFSLEPGEKIIKIDTLSSHTLALTSNGRVFGWGSNNQGQLAVYDLTHSSITFPIDITSAFNLRAGETIVDVEAGGLHSVVVSSEGRVLTFGNNYYGQLGTSEYGDSYVPIDITSEFSLDQDDRISSVYVGDKHNVAISVKGRIFAWGLNSNGQIGDGTLIDRYTPIEITSNFNLDAGEIITNIVVGYYFNMVLTSDQNVFTWGYNNNGQLGTGNYDNILSPIDITGQFVLNPGEKIQSIMVGKEHSFAITSDSRIFGWGRAGDIQFDYGFATTANYPKDISNGLNLPTSEIIATIYVGYNQNFFMTASNDIYAYGSNYNGQIGDGTTDYVLAFRNITPNLVNEVNLYSEITLDYHSDITFVPTLVGYEHSGWYLDAFMSESFTDNLMPAMDTKIYSSMNFDWYQITYHLNGGVNTINNPTGYTMSSTSFLFYDPIQIGCTFFGWYESLDFSSTQIYGVARGGMGEIDLYALWELNEYRIQFEENGGSQTADFYTYYQGAVSAPVDPNRQGYLFDGWYSDSELQNVFVFDFMPLDGATVYAKWIALPFTVDFELNGGTGITSITADAGSAFNVVPERLGYTFSGWYLEATFDTQYSVSTFPTDSITLYAKWTANNYYIFLIRNGGVGDEYIYQGYETVVDTPIVTKTGYVFENWYSDLGFTQLYTFSTMQLGNLQVYAKWVLEEYVIDYELNGGSNDSANPSTYNLFSNSINLADASRVGYTFEGWYLDSAMTGLPVTSIANGSTGGITIYAKWVINEYTISFYEVTDSTTSITAGYSHSVAYTSSGRVLTWGGNYHSQLGDGTTTSTNTPKEITDAFSLDIGETFVCVNAGNYHNIALTTLGRVFSWGYNTNGELGDGTFVNKTVPTEITSMFTLNYGETIEEIYVNGNHNFAITSEHRVFAWGANFYKQLGDSTSISKNTPLLISDLLGLDSGETIVDIALGFNFTIILTSTGRVMSWGNNYYGQLSNPSVGSGNADPSTITSRFTLESGETIINVIAGAYHAFAITSDNRIFAWGCNLSGRLGDGNSIDSWVPVEITSNFSLNSGETILDIQAGGGFAMALSSEGRLFGWGENNLGQLGNGLVSATVPTDMMAYMDLYTNETLVHVSVGAHFTFIGTSINRVLSYGRNDYGQLGDGTNIGKSLPEEFESLILGDFQLINTIIDNYQTDIVYIPTKPSFDFVEWYTDPYKQVAFSETLMPGFDIDVYAEWIPNS
ncbi:MAG: InlB B-repeat-containing protein, partial [Tenericutes bacterium]|nr:InlB B-repeat-containing protein [Mycoplasmatota bacterium]